jgi:hypothetical protein
MPDQAWLHADIFFFIASIGFLVLAILLAVGLIVVIRILRSVKRITDQVEIDVTEAKEGARELLCDIRESFLFRLLFGKNVKKKNLEQKISETKKHVKQ